MHFSLRLWAGFHYCFWIFKGIYIEIDFKSVWRCMFVVAVSTRVTPPVLIASFSQDVVAPSSVVTPEKHTATTLMTSTPKTSHVNVMEGSAEERRYFELKLRKRQRWGKERNLEAERQLRGRRGHSEAVQREDSFHGDDGEGGGETLLLGQSASL